MDIEASRSAWLSSVVEVNWTWDSAVFIYFQTSILSDALEM